MQVQNEQNIPIDIHSNKLLDWLISRRHCSRDWQSAVLVIREKINSAIQDMPAMKEIAELLAGAYINYFHCLKIVTLLKETEASTKNIFGQYSSKRMKDWQDILTLYEKDNVYLAEAAQMLIRNVNYEVPSLKKQISKCNQIHEDLAKKEGDYLKASNDLKEKFYSACKQIGIEGNDVKKELLSLLDDLPDSFNEIASSAKQLSLARDYYMAFRSFTINRDVDECLPLLKHIISKGNTTTYEWKTGIAPEVIADSKPFSLEHNIGHQDALDDQIDFGDLGEFGVATESGDDRSSSTPNGDFVHVDKNDLKDDGVQIDFGESDAEINWDISVDTPGVSNEAEGRVARGDDAATVLDNQYTRNIFFNEIFELEGFLEQRLSEMGASADILSSNQFQTAPSLVHLQTADEIKKMLDGVQQLIAKLTDVKMQHLCLISSSPKYVNRLTESLNQQLVLSEKMLCSREAVLSKQQETLLERKNLEPKLMLIIQKTKILQKQIEEDISKRYKYRPVNIMGGINMI